MHSRIFALSAAIALVTLAGCSPERVAPTVVTPGAFHCAKNDALVIEASDAAFELSGTCGQVLVRGRNNKITIAGAKSLEVTGDRNVIEIEAVDSARIASSGNRITYRRGLIRTAAQVVAIGDNNSVTQTR
jgi:hypothetical protein